MLSLYIYSTQRITKHYSLLYSTICTSVASRMRLLFESGDLVNHWTVLHLRIVYVGGLVVWGSLSQLVIMSVTWQVIRERLRPRVLVRV